MKERPIIFTGESVRAILDGRKTQTRRVVKYIPALGEPSQWCHAADAPEFVRLVGPSAGHCPYGAVGDHLWVRETWTNKWDDTRERWCDPPQALYRADGQEVRHVDGGGKSPWLSPIHMPRWASRITLEVTAVRVERLQDISIADVRAEGIEPACGPDWNKSIDAPDPDLHRYQRVFSGAWDRINGKRAGCAWADDPWVWVLSFRRVQP